MRFIFDMFEDKLTWTNNINKERSLFRHFIVFFFSHSLVSSSLHKFNDKPNQQAGVDAPFNIQLAAFSFEGIFGSNSLY